jgi:hypothetical protein
MQSIRIAHLAFVIVLLSASIILVAQFRMAHQLTLGTALILAYVVFFSNIAVAIVGMFTPRRVSWVFYMVVSVAGMLLLSEPTPLTAVWTLFRVATGI